MDDDLDDTVIVVPRGAQGSRQDADTDDTVIRPRGGFTAPVEAPAPPPPPPPPPPPVALRDDIHSFTIAGARHRLDVPAIVGRNPRAPRIPDGGAPILITVDSPGKEVSSSHVELRQRGSTVIVTDLRSTNGTSVSIPLSQPRKLRQGESIVVSPGSLVDIGDGNIIEILPITAVPHRQEGSRD